MVSTLLGPAIILRPYLCCGGQRPKTPTCSDRCPVSLLTGPFFPSLPLFFLGSLTCLHWRLQAQALTTLFSLPALPHPCTGNLILPCDLECQRCLGHQVYPWKTLLSWTADSTPCLW